MYIVGGYKIDYVEDREYNGPWINYIAIITVYDKDGEIVLCSKGKTEEEFINYLKYVTNEEVIDTITQLYEKGRTREEEEQEEMDFVADCENHSYLW